MSKKTSNILLAISAMLFIISFAVVFIVFLKPFYYFEIDNLGIAQYSGYAKEIIIKNYNVLIDYQSMFYSGVLNMPNFVMSEAGRIHFEEVKVIFVAVQWICLVTGIATIIGTIRRIKKHDYEFLKITSYITVIIPIILAALASINFDQAFVIFHKIFFNNDYWIFDEYTDPVIAILPQDYFMHCAILVVSIVVITCIILYLAYKYLLKKEYKLLTIND